MKNEDIEAHMPLAYSVVNKLLRMNGHLYRIREDLEGVAMLAMVEAGNKFKQMGVLEFSTYAVHAIHNSLINYLERNENRFNRLERLDDITADSSDEGEISWTELIPGAVIDVDFMYSRLTPESQRFITLHQVNEGDTVRTVREVLGVSWEEYNSMKSQVIEEISVLS